MDSVIPICARILGFGGTDDNDVDCEGDEPTLRIENGLATQFVQTCASSTQHGDPVQVIRAPGIEAFPEEEQATNDHGQTDQSGPASGNFTSSFKHPSQFTSIAYVRRTEDISRYILLYHSAGSQPLFTTTRSFEDESHCLITRTHPERTESLRYTQKFHSNAVLDPREDSSEGRNMTEIEDAEVRAAVAEEAFLASVRRAGNVDVVKALWWTWYALESDVGAGWEKGMERVSWHECKEVM